MWYHLLINRCHDELLYSRDIGLLNAECRTGIPPPPPPPGRCRSRILRSRASWLLNIASRTGNLGADVPEWGGHFHLLSNCCSQGLVSALPVLYLLFPFTGEFALYSYSHGRVRELLVPRRFGTLQRRGCAPHTCCRACCGTAVKWWFKWYYCWCPGHGGYSVVMCCRLDTGAGGSND